MITHKTEADGEAVDGAVEEQDATWVGLLWKQNKDPEPWKFWRNIELILKKYYWNIDENSSTARCQMGWTVVDTKQRSRTDKILKNSAKQTYFFRNIIRKYPEYWKFLNNSAKNIAWKFILSGRGWAFLWYCFFNIQKIDYEEVCSFYEQIFLKYFHQNSNKLIWRIFPNIYFKESV